jgi:hypothetical protein
MSRVRLWAEQLDALVLARMNEPFEWGRNDCCMFAADAVQACTGIDPAADLRGSYCTERSAAHVLREFGGVASIAAARLGEEIFTSLAQPGDIGLVRIDGRDSLAVCTGMHWHCPGVYGLVILSGDAVMRAWRI